MTLNHFWRTGIILLILAAISCTKDQKTTSADEKEAGKNSSPMLRACMYGMKGYYHTSGWAQKDSADIVDFVSNGVARLGNSPFEDPYWTSIHTWSSIPDYCYLLRDARGDSLSFSVRLKNPRTDSGNVYAWDVCLTMVGEKNSASACFVGNTQNQHYNYLKIGNSVKSNRPGLVRQFNDWSVLKLEARRDTENPLLHPRYFLSISVDDVIVEELIYPLGGMMGKIKRFEISFKGPGSVDWFRVSGSDSGVGLLRNEFDDITFWGGLQWF